MAIFVTIYNYRAHNYFITIVMKFRNYFPSSINEWTISFNELIVLWERRAPEYMYAESERQRQRKRQAADSNAATRRARRERWQERDAFAWLY